MQNEVSQKEKNKYCTSMHIHNLEKWYRRTCFQGRDREQTCAHSEGRGESGTKWEIGIDIYTLPFSNSHAWM